MFMSLYLLEYKLPQWQSNEVQPSRSQLQRVHRVEASILLLESLHQNIRTGKIALLEERMGYQRQLNFHIAIDRGRQ